ncbi:EAL domain-containing protein [Halomonas kalidii]|uniref:EAL domain-containing protein n=1 Tax=Halomonas kalidii TaxID=3043293 RepID=A0ABT6VMH5_9GAMM|nr:EAL domain-containing protein [Halomonas kalidii]MDI5935172.1 EAL domain-containing protein [Halomonas kalidii]
MPIKTWDLALDTLLLMVAATFVLMGSAALLAGALGVMHYPLRLLLVPSVAASILLCGIGLLAAVQDWTRVRWLAGSGVMALALYTLVHHGLVGIGGGDTASPGGGPLLASTLAGGLLALATCLLLGLSRRPFRWLWLGIGGLLCLGGTGYLIGLLVPRPGWPSSRFAFSPVAVLFLVLLFGGAMVAASRRTGDGGLSPGRLPLLAALAGVGISSLSWFLLSWQQESELRRQADYLLDNIQLNAQQVMRSNLALMRRMAERLDAAEAGLDAAVLDRDVRNYLGDAASLQAIGLLDGGQRWQWGRARDDEDWHWLGDQLGDAEVRDWLAMSFPQPRLMVPESAWPGMALMVIAVPRSGQQLLTALDLAALLDSELRVQLGPFHAGIYHRDRQLLELRPPGVTATLAGGEGLRLARRHIGLPGGPMLRLETYPGVSGNWLLASLVPTAVAASGLALSWLLAFSLGLVSLVMVRSRALAEARHQLEDQQSIQAMIARDRPLDDTLAAVCRMLERQCPGTLCSIMLSEAEGARLRLVVGERLPEAYRAAVSEVAIGPESGACGSAAYLQAPVVCEDLATDPRWQGFHEITAEYGLRACWSYPVVASDGTTLGTFALYCHEPGGPSEQEAALIGKAVGLVALAVERHRVRHSLRESEQRYRSLFAYNPDAVFSLDREGHFVSANATCSTVTGYAVEEMLGAHFAAFVVADDLPRIQGYFEAACRGESRHYELDILNRDGERRALDLLNLPIVVDGRVRGVYGIAKDITERRRQETRLRTLQRGVEASVNGVVIADAREPDMPIVYANATFMKMTGYREDEILGRNCRFMQGEETDPEAVAMIRRHLAEQREVLVTLRNYRKDGTPFWNDAFISPVRDGEGRVTHFVGVLHDISEHKAYEARLAYHASHDALTGLANRALFEDRLAHDFTLARRHGHRLAVLFVDLDDFKPINDSLGHAVGDRVLMEVARRLADAVRPGDTLARLGGDEFVILLPDLHHEEQAMEVAERLLPMVARPYCVDGHEHYLTCSVGIAVSRDDTAQPQELIQQADMAMYKAKQQGRNAYQWFTREITEKVGERVALRNDLQEAIDGGQFELHYQPLIGRGDRLAGVEALLRWNHPVKGYVSPARFIPLAESTGQIMPISEWVLERACRDMQALAARGLGQVRVAVNLSPLQFHRASFLATLRHTLQRTGLPPEQLELELTEGILMDDTEAAIDILHALRSLRIGVSIDDFGTGYSSLSYLKHLPIGKVKIDRSFINEVTLSAHDAAIVQGIISMAHHLGLAVVAEGIETAAQHQRLADYGCDIFQGFLLARPMPLDRLEAFLRARLPA